MGYREMGVAGEGGWRWLHPVGGNVRCKNVTRGTEVQRANRQHLTGESSDMRETQQDLG